jgi:glycosyltransferase involved in cell wall biosynthesis
MSMKILFLDQSGHLGGAELSLLSISKNYRSNGLVCLFADGTFRQALEDNHIPHKVLAMTPFVVNRQSGLFKGLLSLSTVLPIILQVIRLSRKFDLIYANTQKAFVIGAVASYLSHRPLVFHLRDVLSADHFSSTNLQLVIFLANHHARLVIANSEATKIAFIEAGGKSELVQVAYNGFNANDYVTHSAKILPSKDDFGFNKNQYLIGHFSRLSPWKGQHILLTALSVCPENIAAIFVGDALFGEQEYVQQLHQQVQELGLAHRVRFLGFRSDIPELMSVCDLIAHTSTAPEPFGRVIVEAMLCGKPIVAAGAGGTSEIIEHDKTGWLTQPGNAEQLAKRICQCVENPQHVAAVAQIAKQNAMEKFSLTSMSEKIDQLLNQVISI